MKDHNRICLTIWPIRGLKSLNGMLLSKNKITRKFSLLNTLTDAFLTMT